jgi:DNA polymerase-1
MLWFRFETRLFAHPMSKKKSPLILVDGSSYLYRAYHIPNLQKLSTADGRPTGAIRGVTSMIRRLHKDYPDSTIVVVFDAKGKTFRHELYKEYKANRPPMPEDLREQIEPIHNIIRAMGLPLLIIEGVEADDVIGTLAHEATHSKVDVVISTGDKDMAQLVSDHVTLVNTMTETTMDRDGVVEKFGIAPEQIIDYLALVGDKVDNIPGVEKCGPKTAVKWLLEYNNLKGVMDNAENIGGKIGESLRNALEQLPLSHELATIKTDCELDVKLSDLAPEPPDDKTLLEIFQDLEFRSWTEELLSGDDAVEDAANGEDVIYDIITDEKTFDAWVGRLKKAKLFAFDTETTSLNYMEAKTVGVSFAVKTGEAAYVPFGHDYIDAPTQLDKNKVLKKLKPLLEDEKLSKVGQNLKYDRNVLLNEGIELKGIAFDTMLESYVYNSTATRHDMDSLALKYLGRKTIHYEDIAGKGAKQIPFSQVAIEEAGPYAAEDADITLRLHEKLFPLLKKEKSLLGVFSDIEMPLLPVVSRMERNGAMIDAKVLGKQSRELAKRIDELEKEAFDLAGEEFNLGSPKQLQQIFFEKLELPVIKKTPKGQPSTAEPVLQELALDYPLPKVILEYRSLSKLKSTYTDKLPEMICGDTGRVHSSFHQAVTATGRFSSSDPNLQNIPIRTEEGRRVRQAFAPPKGYKLVAADYSQIELRIMAHLSGDKGLLDAFAQGLDIHRATAAEVFGESLDNVSDDQRRSAKAINFGLIYGMSAFGLGRQLNISRNDAQSYIDTYFERYPGVLQYMDNTRKQAAENGYVETIFGRRLYLPEINARNAMQRQAAERTAINAPMQGSAADIIKRAMIDVDNWLAEEKVDARMILQVHDELVLEVNDKEVDAITKKLCDLMSSAAELKVPLIVDAGSGDNWDQAH